MYRPSLFKSMASSFGLPFCLAAVLKLCHDICQFVGPIMLENIINFLSDDDPSVSDVAVSFRFYSRHVVIPMH